MAAHYTVYDPVMKPALAALVALAACGGGDPVDDGPIRLRGRCDAGERVGGFEITAAESESFVSGSVADRVNPIEVRTEIAAAGACRLLRREAFFCDPGCSGIEVCGAGNQCSPLPEKLDVGPIRVSGMAAELVLEPRPPGNDYFDTEVAHPVFAAGDEIRLRGGDLSLDGLGSEPLSGAGAAWLVAAGEPIAVSWDPPAGEPAGSIRLRLTIDQHGNTPSALICELPDTGSGEVPAEMVDALLGAGVSGFPNATITRATSDATEIEAGCVDLVVGHPRNPDVSVDGHTPCNAPGQCPAGQTCDLEAQTCASS